eukprot:TRINITY_DN2455_c0_g2_i1.p1 TRINITY_DN2455_c0_g2~~TRINITY_DN2455_c0_g2_i1.p1  ORF type:complete len:135 (+),score=24.36 TRINITY_DN2455_c0_g2_i1:59-463(+)
MVFDRFFEVGRVAKINYGNGSDTVVVICDLLDANKSIVGDVNTGMKTKISNSRIVLTGMKINLPRGARASTVKKVCEEADVFNKFKASAWGEKINKRVSASERNDFDRFKLMVFKQRRNRRINAEVKALKAKRQ